MKKKSIKMALLLTLFMTVNAQAQIEDFSQIEVLDQSVNYENTCPVEAPVMNEDPVPAPADTDLDGIVDESDNCPLVANLDQSDFDLDNIGDNCDLCAIDPNNDSDSDTICAAYMSCQEQLQPRLLTKNIEIPVEEVIYDPSTVSCEEGLCESFLLTASLDHINELSHPVLIERDEPISFSVPAALEVTVGNSGNFSAFLRFSLNGGTEVSCEYRGGSSSATPSGPDADLGDRYYFHSCSDNLVYPGFSAVADSLSMELDGGVSSYCPAGNCNSPEEFTALDRTVANLVLYEPSEACNPNFNTLVKGEQIPVIQSVDSNGLDISAISVSGLSDDGQISLQATCSGLENSSDEIETSWILLDAPDGVSVASQNGETVSLNYSSEIDSGTVTMQVMCRQGCLETTREGTIDLASVSALFATSAPAAPAAAFSLGGGTCSLNTGQAVNDNSGGSFFGVMLFLSVYFYSLLRSMSLKQSN